MSITIQMAIITATSALVGATIGAVAGTCSTVIQIRAENKRADKIHLFNARRDTYEQLLGFLNRMMISRFYGEETEIKKVSEKEREMGIAIVSRLTLYSSQGLAKDAKDLLSFFDQPIVIKKEQEKEKKEILGLRDNIVKKMRQEFGLDFEDTTQEKQKYEK